MSHILLLVRKTQSVTSSQRRKKKMMISHKYLLKSHKVETINKKSIVNSFQRRLSWLQVYETSTTLWNRSLNQKRIDSNKRGAQISIPRIPARKNEAFTSSAFW